VTLYVESSAVLAWLLGEPDGKKIRRVLATSKSILSSDLTLVECDRVLIRAVSNGILSEAEAAHRRALFAHAAAHWSILRLDDEIVERARRPFPEEPIRTLDAIHLACALRARSAVAETVLVSLDRRVRSSARALGLPVMP